MDNQPDLVAPMEDQRALDLLRNEGLNDVQIADLAKRGLVPSMARRAEANQAMQQEQEEAVQAEELVNLRQAQGDYEQEQGRLQQFGLQDTPAIASEAPADPMMPTGNAIDPSLVMGATQADPVEPEITDPNRQAAMSYLAQANPGYQMAMDAIAKEGAINRDQGIKEAQVRDGYIQKLDELQAEKVEREAEREQERLKVEADLDQATKDLGSTKIDPKRFWANKSTGEKILAGLTLAISGYAQGLAGRGGPAPALQMMQKAMNDDIADQKSQYGIKKEELGGKKSAYGRMLDKYKNEDAAMAATKSAIYERMQNELGSMAARRQGTQASVNAEKAMAQLEIAKNQEKQNFSTAMLNAQAKLQKNNADMREYTVPGAGYAYSKKGAEKMKEVIADFDYADQTVNEMSSLIDSYGVGENFKPSELSKRLESMASVLRGKLRLPLFGPGVIDKYEREIQEGLVPNGASSNPLTRRAAKFALKAIQTELRKAKESQLKANVEGYKSEAEELGLKKVK